MRALYNILFILFFCLSAPYYFWKMRRRGGWRDGFEQRFGHHGGRLKQALTNRDVLWLHAVSVGEVNVCAQLIQALEPRVPNLKMVVSTTTTTGMGRLREQLPAHIEKIYYPVDRRACVRRALAAVHPIAVVLVEAEIWPNFLWHLQDAHTPAFLINARLSERSFRGYRRFGFLFRPLFASFNGVGAQNDADAARLRELGCRADAIRVVGNLKFDAAQASAQSRLDVPALFRQIGWPADALALVGGSTHAGEESLLAEMFQRLRRRFPTLRLVLVPRHFERGRAVGGELQARGVKFVYRNELTAERRFETDEVECLLVNTTGELRYFYEQASVIFVGKSLTAEGGQNPIEPGAIGKAMVFGPNMQNFTAIAESFVRARGAVQVRNATELESAVGELLEKPDLRLKLGENALRVVKENQGAVERTADMIVEELARRGVYVAGK
jgi:3-deoxy-D-manno-octulosonic-acid transferase